MPLNDVKFTTLAGGLGRTTAGEDHVSAFRFTEAAPSSYDGAKCKSFGDLASIESAGVTEGHATYGEAWYQCREFFRIAPGSTLWLCFGAATYLEINTAAAGKIRQLGTYFTTFADLTAVHQAGATALAALHAPIQILAAYRGPTLAVSGLADQAINTAPNVSVLVAGDGDGDGAALATTLTLPYVPALGAVLGAMAKARVSESIAWVEPFNLSDGLELEVIALPDGTKNPSESILSGLNDKRYLVLRKHVGISGTYLNDSHTAVIGTSDFAYIESNRTIQKAKRLIRSFLLPQLNAPLTVDADTGKLAAGSVKFFEQLAGRGIDQMQNEGEVSGYAVFINPDQNVLSTSKLQIQVKIVPRGVARNIEVLIGFAVNTSF